MALVCLSVSLSVSNITFKAIKRFLSNFQDSLAMIQGTIDEIAGVIWI